MEIIENPNKDSTDNDGNYHGDQSDQPKKSVRLYEWGKSDRSRSASASCLQKVIHFVREKNTHLPLKLNVIVWGDICAGQFCLRYVFFILSKFEAPINLNERHHGKGPIDGIGGTLKILCTVILSQERLSLMMQRDLPSMPIKLSREFHPCIC